MFVLIESLFPFIRCIDPLVPENILRILGNINVILRRISFLNDKSVICNYMEVQIIFNRSHVTHIFLQRVKWILRRHPNNLRPLHCLVFPLPFFDQRFTKKWKPLEKPRNRFGRIFGEILPAVTPTRKLCTPLSLYIWCFRENYLWMLFISTYTSAAVIGNENAFTVWAHTKSILFLESRNTDHHVSKRNRYFE